MPNFCILCSTGLEGTLAQREYRMQRLVAGLELAKVILSDPDRGYFASVHWGGNEEHRRLAELIGRKFSATIFHKDKLASCLDTAALREWLNEVSSGVDLVIAVVEKESADYLLRQLFEAGKVPALAPGEGVFIYSDRGIEPIFI